MRERLAELNWWAQPNLVKKGVRGELVPGFDSKPRDLVAGPPSLSARQMEKVA
jgi:hypothetical protein